MTNRAIHARRRAATPQATHSTNLRPTPLVLALHLALVGGTLMASGWSTVAHAQGADTVSSPAEAAPKRYDIPAGPLGTVMAKFAGASGVLLAGASDLVQGRNSPGLSGTFTAAAAIKALLSGTGLEAVRQANGSYALRQAAEPTPANPKRPAVEAVLPVVTVKAGAELETANGPAAGYVARRNATATKTDTPIIETPQSISVVTRDEMDARGVRDVGEAAAYTAGVFSGSQGETALFGGNAVKVRGFGGSGTAGFSFNEYLDGLKLRGTGYDGANLDPYLFERVEVLKGPASVLFGQTQPGGVVNMVSKRPSGDAVNEIRVSTGNRDRLEAAFDIGGTLNENSRFRITGLGLDGSTQQDHSDRKRQLLAPSLTWANSTTSLTLLAHYQRDDINATVLSIVPRDGLFSNPNGRVSPSLRVGDPGFEFWDRETWSVGYLFSHALTDTLTVRQNLRYSRNQLDSRWLFRRSLDADRRTLNRSAFGATEDAGNLTLDNQLEWKVETGAAQHTFLAGIDYQRLSRDAVRRWGFAGVPAIDLFTPVYHQTIPTPPVYQSEDVTERQLGVYVQDQVKIGSLSLLAGARYDSARSSARDRMDDTTTDQRDHAFTGRLGAIYNFANGFAPYVSYSESFEPVSGTAFDGTRFEPMKGKQTEAGIKYQPPGSNHLLTAAIFDLTQRNMTTSDPNNLGWSTQTGEVRTRGVELEGKASFDNGLSLAAAYTYLDDEVTKSNDSNLGKRRAQVPTHNASLWADYTVRSGALSGLGVGLGARRTGKTQGDSGNTFSVPGYTLIDLALRYDLGSSLFGLRGWRADVVVNNLFDKDYVPSCFASHSCYIGVSRSVRATLKYQW